MWVDFFEKFILTNSGGELNVEIKIDGMQNNINIKRAAISKKYMQNLSNNIFLLNYSFYRIFK